jgi:hypothetical protein
MRCHVEVHCFEGFDCFHVQIESQALLDGCLKSNFNPEDCGGIVLRNVGEFLLDYMVSHRKRLFSSRQCSLHVQELFHNFAHYNLT